jgi:hypothetical protein
MSRYFNVCMLQEKPSNHWLIEDHKGELKIENRRVKIEDHLRN